MKTIKNLKLMLNREVTKKYIILSRIKKIMKERYNLKMKMKIKMT